MAGNKYISNVAGALTEVISKDASAGAGDAGKIVALGAAGVLVASIVNSVTTSAGSGDSAKLVALDGAGKIDNTMMPVGVGADTASITASETIAAGALINLHVSSGDKVRNADASNGRRAQGFTLLGAASAAACVVYFEGRNTALTGRTTGATQYLSGSTPGAMTETAPSTSGYLVQEVGIAVSSTTADFEAKAPITLA